MICKNCGTEIGSEAFCYKCGATAKGAGKPDNKKYIIAAVISAIIILIILIAVIAFILIISASDTNSVYNEAASLYEEGSYKEALSLLEEGGGSEKAEELKEECYKALYQAALKLYNEESYEDAAAAFGKIEGYKDADSLASDCSKKMIYIQAKACYDSGDYENALNYFNQIAGYEDADSFINSCNLKTQLEDCKNAYIKYLTTAVNTYMDSDQGNPVESEIENYYLYDFDGNGIPELITKETIPYYEAVPGGINKIFTYYNGAVTRVYEDYGFKNDYFKDSDGVLYIVDWNLDSGPYDVYKGKLEGTSFSLETAYKRVYLGESAPDTNGEYEERTVYDIGLADVEVYDIDNLSPIYDLN